MLGHASTVCRHGYAGLDESGRRLLAAFCRGRRVTDLGAGRGELSRLMVELGAREVVAVDRLEVPPAPGVSVRQERFERLKEAGLPRRLLVSWPINDHTVVLSCALENFLRSAEEILYIGRNEAEGFTVCGWPGLWRELLRRRVLAHTDIPGHNAVIRYGARGPAPRCNGQLLSEEDNARRVFLGCAADAAHRSGIIRL